MKKLADLTVFNALMAETAVSVNNGTRLGDRIGGGFGKALGTGINKIIDAGALLGKGAAGAGNAIGKAAMGTGRVIGKGAVGAGRAIGKGAVGAGSAIGKGAVGAGGAIGKAAATTGRAIGGTAAGAGRALGGKIQEVRSKHSVAKAKKIYESLLRSPEIAEMAQWMLAGQITPEEFEQLVQDFINKNGG